MLYEYVRTTHKAVAFTRHQIQTLKIDKWKLDGAMPSKSNEMEIKSNLFIMLTIHHTMYIVHARFAGWIPVAILRFGSVRFK